MKIIVLYMKIKLKFKAMLLMLLKINKPVTDGFRMFKLIYVHIEKNNWGICFIKKNFPWILYFFDFLCSHYACICLNGPQCHHPVAYTLSFKRWIIAVHSSVCMYFSKIFKLYSKIGQHTTQINQERCQTLKWKCKMNTPYTYRYMKCLIKWTNNLTVFTHDRIVNTHDMNGLVDEWSDGIREICSVSYELLSIIILGNTK